MKRQVKDYLCKKRAKVVQNVKDKAKDSELQELEERLKRAKSQCTLIYLDLKIVEFSHQGKSAPQISDLLGLHANTVRTIIKKFQAKGFKGLQRKPRGKPEQKLKAYDKAYWEDILSQPPRSFEKLETPDQNWTYELIQHFHSRSGSQVL